MVYSLLSSEDFDDGNQGGPSGFPTNCMLLYLNTEVLPLTVQYCISSGPTLEILLVSIVLCNTVYKII